jgi:hypothetical protein
MRNPLITLKNMMITKLSLELIEVALELVAFHRTLPVEKWLFRSVNQFQMTFIALVSTLEQRNGLVSV